MSVRGDNMRGSYRMMDWEKTRVTNMVTRALQDLKEYEIDDINFTREDVNPYNLKEGLEALGYIYEDREDNNYDYWWYFINKHHYLCITFNAESFNLKMFFVEEEV
jgi:hypothetical protein